MTKCAAGDDSDTEHTGGDVLFTVQENVTNCLSAQLEPSHSHKTISSRYDIGAHAQPVAQAQDSGGTVLPSTSATRLPPVSRQETPTADAISDPLARSLSRCAICFTVVMLLTLTLSLSLGGGSDRTTSQAKVPRKSPTPSPLVRAPVRRPVTVPTRPTQSTCSSAGLTSLQGCCDGTTYNSFSDCCSQYFAQITNGACRSYSGDSGGSGGGSSCSYEVCSSCGSLPSGYDCPGDVCCCC